MVLTKKDKELLLIALDTDIKRRERAIRAERNQAVKELWDSEKGAAIELSGRVNNEVAK